MINFPSVTEQEVAAVKRMSCAESDSLKEQIKQCDPTFIFGEAKPSTNPDKKFINCPICGNGTGEDKTPVEVNRASDGTWLYNCFRGCGLAGDLIKVIATIEHLNLNSRDDFCKALAIGANLIGYSLDSEGKTSNPSRPKSSPASKTENKKPPINEEELKKLIRSDIERAREKLDALPKDQRRGLNGKTLAHFGFGYNEKWVHPKMRIQKKNIPESRRIIIPTSGNHYNAVAPLADRPVSKKPPKFWKKPKIHVGKMDGELFNKIALKADTIIIFEGEFDAASVWQAFDGKIAVVAVLGMGNWRATLLPLVNGLHDKNFIIVFDGNPPQARDAAENLRGELMRRGYPAVCRFYYDALMTRLENHQKVPFEFTDKIDANDILRATNDFYLQELTQEIIDSAQEELVAAKKEIEIRAQNQSENQPPAQESAQSLAKINFKLEEQQRRLAELTAEKNPSPEQIVEIHSLIRQSCEWCKDKNGKPTKIKAVVQNYNRIFNNDPNLVGLFGFDYFRQEIIFKRRAIWHSRHESSHEVWADSDDSELRLYLAEHFGDLSNTQMTLDYTTRFARENSFHAIKTFFNELPQWDGVPRAERLFADFLGAADNEYTRAVTRAFLLGAIARAFYPGCDFQYVVVLQGAQGIGKSRLLRMLGGKHGVNPEGEIWHVALRDQLDDSHAVDAMRKGWVIEIEEFAAASRADVNSMKGVLSADDVTRRFAYDRRAKTVKAHWIFVATTNDNEPLRDQTGNRRYLPIKCNNQESTIVKGMTPEHIRQVWAEAYRMFKEMFPTDKDFDADKLRLPIEIQRQAAAIAQGITRNDGLEIEITSFLNRLILPQVLWLLLTKKERRDLIKNARLVMINALAEFISRRRSQGGNEDEVERDVKLITECLTPASDKHWLRIEHKDFKGNEVDEYILHGSELRQRVCASEICHECLGGDPRKYTTRLNEILSKLDGWELGTRLQKADLEYNDQRKPFYRKKNNCPPEERTLALPADSTAEETDSATKGDNSREEIARPSKADNSTAEELDFEGTPVPEPEFDLSQFDE